LSLLRQLHDVALDYDARAVLAADADVRVMAHSRSISKKLPRFHARPGSFVAIVVWIKLGDALRTYAVTELRL